jgi:hypothetical protein
MNSENVTMFTGEASPLPFWKYNAWASAVIGRFKTSHLWALQNQPV